MSSTQPAITKQSVDSLFTNWENRQTCSDQQLEITIELLEKKQAALIQEIQQETEKLIEGLKNRSSQLVLELDKECQEKKRELVELLKGKQELKELVSTQPEDNVDDQIVRKVQEFVNSKTVHNLEKFPAFEIDNLKADQLLKDWKFGKVISPNAHVKTNTLTSTSSAPVLTQNVERRPRNASFMRLPSPSASATSNFASNSSSNFSSPRSSVQSTEKPSASTPKPSRTMSSTFSTPQPEKTSTERQAPSTQPNTQRFSRSFSLIPGLISSPIKFDEKIDESYQEMRGSTDISFISMEYDEKDAKYLKLSKSGKSLNELVQQLTADNSVHAIVRVCAMELDDVVRDRYVAVTFIGENVRQVRRGAITANINHFIAQYGLTVSIHLKDVDSIRNEIIEKLKLSSSGSKLRGYKFME